MTQEIIKLVHAFADAVCEYVASDYVSASHAADLQARAEDARAAVVAALEAQATEIERLQREVVNRNQRALDGDLAVKVRDAEFLVNDKLREQIAALTKDAERYRVGREAEYAGLMPTFIRPGKTWADAMDSAYDAAIAAQKVTT